MGKNILVTGAAGYIGGSVLAELIACTSGPTKAATFSAAVRSEEQVQALSELAANVIQLDLKDESAVSRVILDNDIDIVIHTASSAIPEHVSNLIKPLGQRHTTSGQDTYFIHSSITALFSKEAGWPFGDIRDTEPILEKEKELLDSSPANPVRQTNVLVTELSKQQGVTSFDIAVPNVYGRGTGEWRKISVNIPAQVRASMEHRTVYKFDKDGVTSAVHVEDLAKCYALLVEKILEGATIPSGEHGHYFADAHRASWWRTADHLAKCLYERGLVDSHEPKVWPSYEMAAESLGFPLVHIRPMGMSTPQILAVNAYDLGWQPKWDEKRFFASIDDEIQAVLELDIVKPSVFDVFKSQ